MIEDYEDTTLGLLMAAAAVHEAGEAHQAQQARQTRAGKRKAESTEPEPSAPTPKKLRPSANRPRLDEAWKKPLKEKLLNELDAQDKQIAALRDEIKALNDENDKLQSEAEELEAENVAAAAVQRKVAALTGLKRRGRELVAWYDQQIALIFTMAREGDLASISEVENNIDDERQRLLEESGLLDGSEAIQVSKGSDAAMADAA